MTNIPKLVMFDLDGTLARSKQALTRPLSDVFGSLIEKTTVAVISGGALTQLVEQVVERLPADTDLKDLYLLPTSGAALYAWDGNMWKKVYEERISERDAKRIGAAVTEAVEKTAVLDLQSPSYGPRIEYRGSQVTFSALGQNAPLDEKEKWDPDTSKRQALIAVLARSLPEFSIALGGMTSLDITRKGIDKAYGLRKLCTRLGIAETDVLYVGDQLGPDGNDEAIFKTNAQTRAVRNPEETSRVILSLVA